MMRTDGSQRLPAEILVPRLVAAAGARGSRGGLLNKVGEALPRQRPVFANDTVAPRRSGPGQGSSARNAWAAILSGITFIILFTAGLVLINQIPRLDSPDSTYVAFYATGTRGLLVTVGLYIVPFSGIAFCGS
jgi:hypothetical protein